MLSYIKGEVTDIEPDKVVIENNGIGYNVFVPLSVIGRVSGIGEEVKLYTYLSVKEDSMTLFGFLSKEELKIFKMILSVSGIGPKGALGILSTLSPDELRIAVLAGDKNAISKAPGIGQKTALKLIIELKDKLDIEDVFVSEETDVKSGSIDASVKNDAIQALVALGYSKSSAASSIKGMSVDADTTVEDVIKYALKNML